MNYILILVLIVLTVACSTLKPETTESPVIIELTPAGGQSCTVQGRIISVYALPDDCTGSKCPCYAEVLLENVTNKGNAAADLLIRGEQYRMKFVFGTCGTSDKTHPGKQDHLLPLNKGDVFRGNAQIDPNVNSLKPDIFVEDYIVVERKLE